MLLFIALLLHVFSGFVTSSASIDCQSSTNNMFDPPADYNGHRCYQSTYYYLDAHQAERMCLSCGWYLAEINTEGEFRFLQNLARNKNTEGLLLSGNDMTKEGYWVFQTSMEPVKFFDWSTGNPSNYQGKEHFMSIHRTYNYQMNDVSFEPPGNYKFLCEM
ncbi:ladderlectin-like [Physella acuta]|uniref:ladderlectin-like n=1 Tax=Physella acuta TaxID=109671 RepID=UPI0027DBD965|nr:ladderlectin-like [Physella acuta]